jgi:hypothetical protein
MDPNAAREQMIEKANTLLALAQQGEVGTSAVDLMGRITETGVALAEQVHALDEWLRAGGFFPDAWAIKAEGDQLGRKQDVEHIDVNLQPAKPPNVMDIDALYRGHEGRHT